MHHRYLRELRLDPGWGGVRMVGAAVVQDQEDPCGVREPGLQQAVPQGPFEGRDAVLLGGLPIDAAGEDFEKGQVAERPVPLILKLEPTPPPRARRQAAVEAGERL